jgi:hypothetical protein
LKSLIPVLRWLDAWLDLGFEKLIFSRGGPPSVLRLFWLALW